jgi:prepilin-type N-terminal cleavage/methylation domain-containing protein
MLNKLKNRKSDQAGFTIIEVLIVLAIAGLILLIVFLAVPALQRSSRNTQRKNDAAAVGGAVANFISNNNGALPVSAGSNATTTLLDVCAAGGGVTSGATACTATKNLESAKIGYYGTTALWFNYAAPRAAVVKPTTAAVGSESATKVSTESVLVVTGQDCTPTLSTRTAAIYYATETGSGNGSLQCIEQ